jgi:hypothetical protein
MNPLFKGLASNNPKDSINFIIMILHEELNMTKNNAKIIFFTLIKQINK